MLRHEDPKFTEAVYGHLERSFLKDSVDRLRWAGLPELEPEQARIAVGATGEPPNQSGVAIRLDTPR